jgi:hypothetical protein
MVGQQVGKAASGMFELELEGLSGEDQEFEVARAIVRLASDADHALASTPGTGNPNEDAKNALIQSAIHNAPGLLVRKPHHHHHHQGNPEHASYAGDMGESGHWHRRGNKIIIENAF